MADDVDEGVNRTRNARPIRSMMRLTGVACCCVDRRGHARGDRVARATRRATMKRTPVDAARGAGHDATGAT
ncbi:MULTISPECIES: hypothetical protein [unclassified Burkholderia]|uniref:hypothetical protein n=1 Tax=unclassified Burkholderia TaxID=2613784 RepID=UPI000F58DE19|nr:MULTISPECIES: hypothetical protein [unclassified Burkholderia]RQR90322.1 hypothetical protein DIE10_01560 [Burkholderia sp. Bp9011]RQR99328.1 hypothetical protein DIE09_01740 [Burkholderia sp. Bp9010]RQS13315.1 hypothetical protein DIE02_04155 [Burkholderia sp. Bp8991]RQS82338.1 hypothetical protein DID97_01525 [Burkholderia sp. Bp8977]